MPCCSVLLASTLSQLPPPLPAAGVMFSATQTVQLLYRCVLRLLGTPEQHAAAEDAFAQSAAWGASVEAILVVSWCSWVHGTCCGLALRAAFIGGAFACTRMTANQQLLVLMCLPSLSSAPCCLCPFACAGPRRRAELAGD